MLGHDQARRDQLASGQGFGGAVGVDLPIPPPQPLPVGAVGCRREADGVRCPGQVRLHLSPHPVAFVDERQLPPLRREAGQRVDADHGDAPGPFMPSPPLAKRPECRRRKIAERLKHQPDRWDNDDHGAFPCCSKASDHMRLARSHRGANDAPRRFGDRRHEGRALPRAKRDPVAFVVGPDTGRIPSHASPFELRLTTQ